MVAEQELVEVNKQKRKVAKEAKLAEPAILSGNKFQDPDLDLKLSDELTGNQSILPWLA